MDFAAAKSDLSQFCPMPDTWSKQEKDSFAETLRVELCGLPSELFEKVFLIFIDLRQRLLTVEKFPSIEVNERADQVLLQVTTVNMKIGI